MSFDPRRFFGLLRSAVGLLSCYLVQADHQEQGSFNPICIIYFLVLLVLSRLCLVPLSGVSHVLHLSYPKICSCMTFSLYLIDCDGCCNLDAA